MKTIHAMRRNGWAAVLAMLTLLVFAAPTMAADLDYDTPSKAFSWYTKSPGCVHLTIMVGSPQSNPNRCLKQTTFGVKDGGTSIPVLYLNENARYDTESRATTHYLLSDGSVMLLTNDPGRTPHTWINEQVENRITRMGQGNYYMEIDWYYPTRFAGKNLTFYVDGKLRHEDNNLYDYKHDIGQISFDAINFETYDAMPGTDVKEKGMVKVPFSCDRPLNWVVAKYKDSNGAEKQTDTLKYEHAYYGFITLPAAEKHENLTITANVQSASWNNNQAGAGYPTEVKGDISKTAGNVGQIHNPRMLRAEMDSVGAVVLRWKIGDLKYGDLLPGDAFTIERSLTGKTEDFTALNTNIIFDENQENYEFRDSLLISSLEPQHIDKTLGIPLVRYRVVRATTQHIWGMEQNPCVAYASPQMATLALQMPMNAQADWLNEEQRTIAVDWELGANTESLNFVWDSRAKMFLEILSYNRAGNRVDSTRVELTDEQRRNQHAEFQLSRSCVNYLMRMVVDSGTSAIGKGTGDIYTTVKTAEDWAKVCLMVNRDKKQPNIMLMGDIPLKLQNTQTDLSAAVLGCSRDVPYTGYLNGNGHSLTLDYDVTKMAPIGYIADGAVITGLTVKGTINEAKLGGAGIVKEAKQGMVVIDNCRVSIVLKAGDILLETEGGLLHTVGDSATVIISNSLMDGKFEITNSMSVVSHKIGGFVGVRKAGGYLFIENCYYNGCTNNSYDMDCNTFLCTYDEKKDMLQRFLLQDCLYKQVLGGAQGTQSDKAPQNWCWTAEGLPAVVQKSYVNGAIDYKTDVELPADYLYYQNSGHVEQQSLRTEALQSSVLLTWSITENGTIDYFEVLRREKNESDGEWKLIATQITETEYEDKTVSPIHDYIYKVRSAVDCEGLFTIDTDPVEGSCLHTGKVEGYIRFADGTGIAGKNVIISDGKGTELKCTTDESGFFEKDGIVFYKDGNVVSYTIAPDIDGFSNPQPLSFTTEPGGNYQKNVVFNISQNVKFSGVVMYKGTSIPVQGVSFLVDGREVHTASGKLTSDHEGKFSFRMLPGDHTIQAQKNGHTFVKDGYYYEDDSDTKTRHNFTTDKGPIYFYDATRVKLIGRVAGGKDQGALPLGNSLSHNNLGDDLKMVLVLEGDNASRLVYNVQNRNEKTRDEVFEHVAHDKRFKYQTHVHATEHRLEVTPDVHTGEYVVMLPPVKWKIQQITAQGYPTLFQDGKTGDVIDLTDSINVHTDHVEGRWTNQNGDVISSVDVEYNAKYNRIYHTPVQLTYKQVGYDTFDYLGDRYYTVKYTTGGSAKIPLVLPKKKENWPAGRKDSLEAKYTFDYPVFSIGKNYPIVISATETYYYNNKKTSDTIDVVRLSGGTVTLQNGMLDGLHNETFELDSLGQYTYNLEAKQLPYLLTGRDALRTITMTLEMDGTHYEATPLKAYVLNVIAKKGAKDLISIKKPVLFDVLRDPPGGASSAKLSKGSTMKYAFTLDTKASYGAKIDFGVGTDWPTWQGIGAGVYQSASQLIKVNLDLVWNFNSQDAYQYTVTLNEDISTSTHQEMVGAKADVYIGMETNITMTPAIAIQAIPDSLFNTMKGAKIAGTMVVIAEGLDENNKPIYLVRNETLGLGQTVTSTFAHSQEYIQEQLMVELSEQCSALMFTGSYEEAKAQADATGKPVYWSLRTPDDPNFGMTNTKERVNKGDAVWTYVYNTTQKTASDGMNYMIVLPNGWDASNKEDRVSDLNEAMLTWASFIAQNEKEKLETRTLMRNIDIDGGAPLTYGETFSSQVDLTTSNKNIGTNFVYGSGGSITAGIFGGIIDEARASIKKGLEATVDKLISKIYDKLKGPGNYGQQRNNEGAINALGWKFYFDLQPVVVCDYTPKYTATHKVERKESFTISMDKKSHLNFDVYYAEPKTLSQNDLTTYKNEVFSNVPYAALDNEVINQIFNKHSDLTLHSGRMRGFIYRTRGGATLRPYEGERTSTIYNPGTVLDERTKKIENPVITMDKQSLSGVPYGEAARFKLYLANESEQPTAVYPYYNLFLNERYNPNGAKVMMDGMPLTGTPRVVEIAPGVVTEKTIEVYAGEDFDYENLLIELQSVGDRFTNAKTQFSVHFLRQAGNVEISTPGDKWVMNTDAPYDSIRGWYLPVIISGYNKSQKNFDHIEFQYKESSRGDDFWTNLCGFYADSTLFAAASGSKAMIPENGYINTKFYGEGREIEKAYDLRAVLFCRNGNGFLTNSSKQLSGIKDTRRPRLFGQPEPKDGVLLTGENITFNFSEPIEHNYLQGHVNFEVMGETNETNVVEDVSLLFNGTSAYAESEIRRNFADKNITIEVMIRPDETGSDMPIFSHGSDGKSLQLWYTKDKKLKAVVGDKSLESNTAIDTDGFAHVALVLNNDSSRLKLYGPGIDCKLDNVTYSGYGPLIFGSTNQTNPQKRQYYKGRIIEGRIWERPLDRILLNTYGNKMLTGYEMGLTDYYPMNEGKGDYASDMAHGAHLTLNGATWAQPRGMALRLDKEEARDTLGLRLLPKFFQRTQEQDYTLMFWFRTDENGKGALLSNGSGHTTDIEAVNKFFIGFENDTLKYRTNGVQYELGTGLADGAWHHYAMTVNRSRSIANIYIDNALRQSFSTDTLGGMTGNDFYLGNMVWHEKGTKSEVLHQKNAYSGHIDGVCMFEQALPYSLIERYTYKSVGGGEKGLITYLDFNHQVRQSNNNYTWEPYALNRKINYDANGKATEKHDSVFYDKQQVILDRIDHTVGAPMQAYQELHNLNFNFVGRDHQLLVDIEELDSRINKRQVNVTLYNIPDMNGNVTASPSTATIFIDRNVLRWSEKTHNATLKHNDDSDYEFSVKIKNNSGAAHTYTIENLPKWLTTSSVKDIISAQNEETINFSINRDINVGSYDDIIYLTDENGLSEPLELNITIEGEEPDWEVASEMKQFSMNLVGRVMIGNDILTDSRDVVAVFSASGECMGKSNVSYDVQTAEPILYMTIFSKKGNPSEGLIFKLWHYQTGKTLVLDPSEDIKFIANTTAGLPDEPVLLTGGNLYEQTLHLNAGWNWISFNIQNEDFNKNINTLLGTFNWQEGDLIVDPTNSLLLNYQKGQWTTNNKARFNSIRLDVMHSYRIHTAQDMNISFTGSYLEDFMQRIIHVKRGWNFIGYTPMVNLPVTTALADYMDEADNGDVVKSLTQFAIFTVGTNGSKEWKGNLKYMKPGEGYMLYRSREEVASFIYPFFEPSTLFFESAVPSQPAHGTINAKAFASTMSLCAVCDDIELQPTDRLLALSGSEIRGEAEFITLDEEESDNSHIFYMSIGGDQRTPLTFAIERDGEIVALSTTATTLTYQADAVSGSFDKPTHISFVEYDTTVDDISNEGWYTLQGIRLAGRPDRTGIYIHNGQKQIVK